MTAKIKHCALYTRKSSEEGLDQEFNSLDAQREACAAYVKSQRHEGWRALSAHYDDGGYSGGSMERPSLQRLLADIAMGKVEVVVVYKIDRLSRSLPDFARMVELFDKHNVSFVSVTQAFNTTTSMGRLTLNVLLSFAQFEREVTGERIRDKIAASKAKGMWMGGTLPLGYDRPLAGTRALVVNPAEAKTVNMIFRTYLELGSVHVLQRHLANTGTRSKRWVTQKGKTLGRGAFSRGALFHLLRNRTYLGYITHKGQVHPGQHDPIVDEDLFAQVQAQLDAQTRRQANSAADTVRSPLTSRIFDAMGCPMSPTTAYGKTGKSYRYYVSAPLQQGRQPQAHDDTVRRVSAQALEGLLTDAMTRLLPNKPSDPLDPITRVEIHRACVQVFLPIRHLTEMIERLAPGERAERDARDPAMLRLTLNAVFARRGGRTEIIGSSANKPKPDPKLIKALRTAHSMVEWNKDGFPYLTRAPDAFYQRRLIRLAFLSPDLQHAMLTGRQPPGLTLKKLMYMDLPIDWDEQKRCLFLNGDLKQT
jgi:DNA invertase Pin-like site-specific DNA recombinase